MQAASRPERTVFILNNNKNVTLITDTLLYYKQSKRALEERLEGEHRLWREKYESASGSSAWMFNSIVSKHADVMDNLPQCACLPREECDTADAELLSKILPIITDRCNFEEIYSKNSWEKIKYGTAMYGVFWNKILEDGLGDIDIRALRVEDVFWEPGVNDIQDSKHLFICGVWDIDILKHTYPELNYSEHRAQIESLGSKLYGGRIDTQSKCVVVDHYYKTINETGRVVLHLDKICGDVLLYSSENDPACKSGWYTHAKYPVVVDVLYPEEEGICGFGVISVVKNTQAHIDRIDDNLLRYADWSSRARFWAKKSLGVNENDFRDLSRCIVEVEGDIDEEKLKQIKMSDIDESIIMLRGLKIEELKEITGTREFSQGGTVDGVIAASAIRMLRETGDKFSRDGIEGSCRAYESIINLTIELIRQFYRLPRYFRIKGDCGENKFLCFKGIRRETSELSRRPHFDLEISTIKRSASHVETMNSFAKELFDSGAFKPENIQQTLIMLELMSFDGIGRLKSALTQLSLQDAVEK